MSKNLKILAFLAIGVIISIGKYTIVIGQSKGVLVALNKADGALVWKSVVVAPGKLAAVKTADRIGSVEMVLKVSVGTIWVPFAPVVQVFTCVKLPPKLIRCAPCE